MNLSIIIVNWNTRELLAGCLRSLPKGAGAFERSGIEIFVVDNASSDGSADMVREQFPSVRLIENTENVGFARANNQALREAKGAQLLLLNPDTVVTEGALDRLQHVLVGRLEVGIVGAQLLNADGSHQMSYSVFPSLWAELPLVNRLLNPVRATLAIRTSVGSLVVQSVDWVSGACLMIKREVYEVIGGLDESFWLYTEETDWCYRARAAGWDVLTVPQAQVYHLARAASSQRFALTMLHFYQSRVRFARKHRGPVHASAMKQVLQLKAAIWRRRPAGSPLRYAYRDLSDEQVISAYRTLTEALAMPLSDYLASDWQRR